MKKILVLIIILFLSGCEGSGTSLNINSKDVQNLYKMANPFDDAMVLNLLYKNSGSFDNQYILAVAIQNYLNNYNETILYIPKDDVEKSIFTIFGNNISFYHDKAYLFNNGYCGFDYNQELEQYEMLHGCSGSMEEKFYRKIVDAVQKNDEIIIFEKSIYVYNDFLASDPQVTIYKNIINKDVILNYNSSSNDKLNISIDDYIEQASTYQYVFKKSGDDYIFESFKLVN